VFITTACVAFYKYGLDKSTDIILKLHNHFKTNFYLEVQYHDMTLQKEINKFILDISNKYKIPIIMGCDSHYIHPEESTERQNVLHAKNIFYENEENCILDYPDAKTAIRRFQKQNILNDKEIEIAIKNTNVFLEFEDITFDKNIKLPSIHLEKPQVQKDDIFKNLI
jgi:DNA polymerase III alpha subunit